MAASGAIHPISWRPCHFWGLIIEPQPKPIYYVLELVWIDQKADGDRDQAKNQIVSHGGIPARQAGDRQRRLATHRQQPPCLRTGRAKAVADIGRQRHPRDAAATISHYVF